MNYDNFEASDVLCLKMTDCSFQIFIFSNKVFYLIAYYFVALLQMSYLSLEWNLLFHIIKQILRDIIDFTPQRIEGIQ